jgi:hypothetical protein
MFASRTVTRDALQEQLLKIGDLQARVRAAHLQTRVLQRDLLSAEQTALYMRLCGYAEVSSTEPSAHTHR